MDNHLMPIWLSQRAYLTPDRTAFVTEDETVTFKQLNDRVERKAKKWLELKIKPESKIGILAGNTIEMVELYHSISLVKGIAVPLNTRLTASELIFQLKDCGSSFLIYEKDFFDQATIIQNELPELSVLSVGEFNRIKEADQEPMKEIRLTDPHTIIYTSGTTGFPKGVVLTYGNHWWSAIGSVLNLGLSIEDKWLSCVPLFHVSGLSILMKNVIYGMTVYLYRSFNPSEVNRAIREEQITMISVVTAMLQAMLNDNSDRNYPASLRCILLGGGPAPKILLEMCRDQDIPVYQTYGLTESSSQIVTLSPEFMLEKIGSAGKPLFPAQMKIMANNVETKAFEAGEIFIKGANVTIGYYNRPKENDEVFKNGWLSTGDIGYLDQDGFLFVLDRRKDLIISGGENVYPAEIESVLLRHPKIMEAGVIGVDNKKWGQVPVAFIKHEKNQVLSEEEILSFLEKKLASYKIPKKVYFIEQMPRNASNKLVRRKLYDYLT